MKIQELSPPTLQQSFVRPPKLNVLIGDASGSMSWAMNQLAVDTIDRVNQLPDGDAVMIGLFSNPGFFKWIVARELSSEVDRQMVERSIRQEFYARSTTCFSEIMSDVPQAVKPFFGKFNVINLVFMSDGHPVVPNLQREVSTLMEAATEVRNYLSSAAVVAYGDYANRQLLGELARTLGAELVTAQSVAEIGSTFSRLSNGAAAPRKKVAVPTKGLVFSIDGASVVPLDNRSGEVEVPESARVLVHDPDFRTGMIDDTATIGAALAMLATGQTDGALRLMSDIGDVRAVRQISNALTNAEMAEAEKMLRTMLVDETQRFVAGKQVGCLPTEDAFDLIDLLETLQSDDSCLFYPYDPGFKYKRTGRKSSVDPKYPVFKADDQGVAIQNLTGHSSELNLSIKVNVQGTIKLPKAVVFEDKSTLTREEAGLPEEYRTSIFRNYSLINNALPVVTSLPITCSPEVLRTLSANNVEYYMSHSGKLVVNLTSIPTCNRLRGKKATNWVAMAESAIKSLELGSQLKVYKAKKAELDPDGDADKPAALSDEAATFLDACGVTVKTNVFNPPSTQEPATDVMDVRTFEVKIARSSSVTMKDFLEMMAGNKKINAVGDLMKVAYDDIIRNMPAAKGSAVEWLSQKIKDLTAEKRKIDTALSANKFAVVLGGHWRRCFKEDSATFNVQGWDVTLQVGTIQKSI